MSKYELENLQWYIEGETQEIADGFAIKALPETDFFVTPAEGDVYANAVFAYREVEGDFVLRAKVSLKMEDTYDAAVLLAMDHKKLWAKACFEATDLSYPAIVTVMTNERSDDANGVPVAGDSVWMQLARKGDQFAIHYSEDGKIFNMARYAWLPMKKTIKVGLEAQSPLGQGGWRNFQHVTLERKTLEDIRGGNK